MKTELKNPLENFKMKNFNAFFLGLFIFQRNRDAVMRKPTRIVSNCINFLVKS